MNRIPYTPIFLVFVLFPAIAIVNSLGASLLMSFGIGGLVLFANILGQFEGREYKKPKDSDNGSLG